MLRTSLLILLFWTFFSAVYSQDYLDSNFRQWSAEFRQGKINEVIKASEKNLQGREPNGLAMLVWATTQKASRQNEIPAAFSESLKERASLYQKMLQYEKEEMSVEAFELGLEHLKQHGGPIINYHWADLVEMINPIQSYELTYYTLQQFGEYFRTAWTFDFLSRNHLELYFKLKEDLDNGKFDGFPAIKAFLINASKTPKSEALEDLEFVDQFLQTYPKDPMALRFKAHQLKELGKDLEAAGVYLQAWEVDPFYVYGTNLNDAITSYYKTGNMEKADSLLKLHANVYYNLNPDMEYITARSLKFLGLGRNNEARKILVDVKEEYFDEPKFALAFGKLEKASNRESLAMDYFEKAFQNGPQTLEYISPLIDAYLAADRAPEALEVISRLESRRSMPYNEYYDKAKIFENVEDYEGSYKVRKASVTDYPYSSWHWNNFAWVSNKTDRKEEAYRAIVKSVDMISPSAWASGRFYEYSEALHGKEVALGKLKQYGEKYFWSENLWKVYISKIEDLESKIEVLKAVKQSSSNQFFPYKLLINEYMTLKQWDKAFEILIEAKNNLKGPVNAKETAYYTAEIVRRKGQNLRLLPEEIDTAIAAHTEFARITGVKDDYWYRDMSSFYVFKNQREISALYLDSGLLVNPDSRMILSNIRNKSLSEYGTGKLSRKFWEYIQRDPYDIDRYSLAIDFHVKWGGSPISAIILSQQVKDKLPDEYSGISKLEVRAYGALGDNAKDFEIRYIGENVISSSDRYIGWYNSSRRQVWQGSSKITIDPTTATATILFPDGTMAVRQDDVINGKVRKLQAGNAYIMADYTKEGDLTHLKASNGRELRIVYNDKKEVVQMSSGEDVLSFKYDENGKISEANVNEVGRMEITYDEYGETDEINSYDSKGKEGGSQLVMRINRTIEELRYLSDILQKAQTLQNAQLPDLGIPDEQYESLSTSMYRLENELFEKESSKKRVEWFEKTMELAVYLKDNTHVNSEYANECFYLLSNTREQFELVNEKDVLKFGPQIAEVFHELLIKTRRNGVAEDWWSEWILTLEWLQKEKLAETKLTDYRTSIEKVQEEIRKQPVELLSSSEWLPKSMLQNTGYWKKYGYKSLVKKQYLDGLIVNSQFMRKNGDLVLGTNKGIIVRHNGYWDHLIFNSLSRSFERNLDQDRIRASSNILSITENEDLELILGTADGLLVLKKGSYIGLVKKRYSSLDGLEASSVDHLGAYMSKVYIGTQKGLYLLEEERLKKDETLTEAITFIHQNNMHSTANLALGTNNSLWAVDGNNPEMKKYTDFPVEDALIATNDKLYYLKGQSIFRYENGIFVELYGNIISTDVNQSFGISEFMVNPDDGLKGTAIGAMTDLGISFYHRDHFEHFYLPLKKDGFLQARGHAGQGAGFAINTGGEIHVFEADQIKSILYGNVGDLLTSTALKKTFVIMDSELFYIDHSEVKMQLQLVDYTYSSALLLDEKDRLIANDGATIYRYEWQEETGEFSREELFYANQFEPSDVDWVSSGAVKNMLIAEDGSLWVATKLSVFRYREENGEAIVNEFNYFRDPEKFPGPTQLVHKVHETPDGRIWVVCSNEGHIDYNGINLSGGLLLWNEEDGKFDAQNIRGNYKQRNFNWFMTSVTKVGEQKGIIGTLGGFAEFNNGEISDYYNSAGGLKNSSYNAIYDEYPSLFLGTRGTQVGDLWLFGCASGVLAYRNGNWFYPDRLNQMLPRDLDFSKYGSRVVNAISSDVQGKIYVGTDLGLLIYDSRGADPASFLMNNRLVDEAFAVQNETQLQEESRSILKSIPTSTSSGKIIAQLDDIDFEISRLKRLKATSQSQLLSRSEEVKINSDSLNMVIKDKQKKHFELLLKLEQQDPAIHQLLDIKPVEIAGLRKKLKEGECLIQYIPTKSKLYIQVLAKDKIELRESVVSSDSLMNVSKYVANAIKFQLSMDELSPKLEWLYDQLIRPVQNDIQEYQNIMVIPVQSLYYLPFGTLVERVNESKTAYAVQKYNIAYVSSTYLLGLLLKTNVESSDQVLLFGDPDGSLPGAKEEVNAINKITGQGKVFLNGEASLSNLILNASGAKVVHLATHGYLNEHSPEKSSILMADSKLKLPQIFNLPLDKTEMIVLSACETGKGASNGLEYATIARAFANAGAPTVLASLWKVNDLATRKLMVNFYKQLDTEPTRLEALTSAQRNFLAENPDLGHPYYWGAFILMGKP